MLAIISRFLRRGLPNVAAVCTAGFALACVTPIHVKIPPREDRPTTGHQVLAGAAKVDITPIPGIPMGGFSLEGKLARGVWTRLFARAIYLQDAEGTPLVLVSCDLLQMPAGLSDRVAQLVWEAGLVYIGRENIVLAATHTHNGPAGFFTTRMNTSDTSPSPKPGFDRELFDFIAGRIADAIALAVGRAAPAQLSVELAAGGGAADNALDGVFRNRSIEAFLANPEARERLEGSPLALCDQADPDFPTAAYPDPRACQAIDPNIDVLVLRGTGSGSPLIAVAAFLATHPTVLGSQTEVYSGDLFGVAATHLETDLLGAADCARPTASLPAGTSCPIVALVNGAQGDVSPDWTRRDRPDLLDLADDVAGKIKALVLAASAAEMDLSFQYEFIDPIAGREFDDTRTIGRISDAQRTAEKPSPGAPQLGGAEDGRTLFYELGLQEGRRAVARAEHGAKAEFPIKLGETALSLSPPAKRAPLAVYEITPALALATLPGEFTTAMGQRVREQVETAIWPGSDGRVLLAGLAGGHISYITTPEEYDIQHFEGASNLYGAATGPMLASEITQLASALPSSTAAAANPVSRTYLAAQQTIFRPRALWAAPYSYDDGLTALTAETVSPHYTKRDFPRFCFQDAVPRLKELAEVGGACERNIPEVTIEKLASPDAIPVADSWGLEVVTVMTQVAKARTEWCAIWLRPETLAASAEQYRFHVQRIRGEPLDSPPFTPSSAQLGPPPLVPLEPLEPFEPDAGWNPWCGPTFDWLGLCTDTCEEVAYPP